MAVIPKDPSSNLDYGFDFSPFLTGDEAITTVSWTVFPVEDGGLQVATVIDNGPQRSAVVSGGVPGHQYRLQCSISTDQGRSTQRSLTLRVMER